MKFKKDIHNQRARIGTSVFVILLLVFLFFFGLTYMDPAPEGGIPISFGYEVNGSGNTSAAPPPSKVTPPTPVEQTPQTVNDVVTQDNVDAPSVNKEDKKPKNQEKPKETKEKPKETPQEPVVEDPKPSNALSKMLGKVSSQDDAGKGEGDKTGGSDQGDPNGDRKSTNRVGTGGTGSGNYRLGGRGALFRPTPKYDCTDEGRVVVKVYVNRDGKVINAIGGEQIPNGPASNTTSTCLRKRAEEAAMKTTWAPDSKAPDQQIGYIVYNFSKN